MFFFIVFFCHSNSKFQHELLNRPTRRLLKDDAIITLFAHNLANQPQKHRTSLLREETAAKRQLCENAFYHNESVKSFEYDINTKETQVELHGNSVSSMASPEVTSISNSSFSAVTSRQHKQCISLFSKLHLTLSSQKFTYVCLFHVRSSYVIIFQPQWFIPFQPEHFFQFLKISYSSC